MTSTDHQRLHKKQLLSPSKCILVSIHRQGVILEQAYGGPSSGPGKAALLTGRYSSRSSVIFHSKIFCSPPVADRQGYYVKLPLVLMSSFVFTPISIFYRTGLPLVSPATLEPMGLPTDFKLLPKVDLISDYPPYFSMKTWRIRWLITRWTLGWS